MFFSTGKSDFENNEMLLQIHTNDVCFHYIQYMNKNKSIQSVKRLFKKRNEFKNKQQHEEEKSLADFPNYV